MYLYYLNWPANFRQFFSPLNSSLEYDFTGSSYDDQRAYFWERFLVTLRLTGWIPSFIGGEQTEVGLFMDDLKI